MAATLEANRLTEAHRIAQARLGARTVQQMFALWPLLDPAELDATFARWLRVVLPLIESQRTKSSALAANYLTAFRALELGMSGSFVPALAPVADITALTTSMTVTGPVLIRAAIGRGVQLTKAVQTAQASSASSAMRHALNGGRETIIDNVGADTKALGWSRTTSGKPCHFCAMLASRGPVFKGKSFDRSDPRFVGPGKVKVHDGCHCGVEPVYHSDADWPASARRAHDLWQQSTRGLSGDAARNAFREALNA